MGALMQIDPSISKPCAHKPKEGRSKDRWTGFATLNVNCGNGQCGNDRWRCPTLPKQIFRSNPVRVVPLNLGSTRYGLIVPRLNSCPKRMINRRPNAWVALTFHEQGRCSPLHDGFHRSPPILMRENQISYLDLLNRDQTAIRQNKRSGYKARRPPENQINCCELLRIDARNIAIIRHLRPMPRQYGAGIGINFALPLHLKSGQLDGVIHETAAGKQAACSPICAHAFLSSSAASGLAHSCGTVSASAPLRCTLGQGSKKRP